MTIQLQPLDVSINKPFKDHVNVEYENWLHLENHPLTASGKIKKRSTSKISEWIPVALKKVSNEIIIYVYSFKKYSINNALDGVEDENVRENGDVGTSSEVNCGSGSDESFSEHDSDVLMLVK
ncbi:hypothetical protein TNCV_5057561 [Trichonephila clavipes]|nr:hypothetical protein TNCV_5057561 [Trichonephila clavipes]